MALAGVLVVGIGGLFAPAAVGQEERSEAWEEKRREKAAEVDDPEPGWLERKVMWLEGLGLGSSSGEREYPKVFSVSPVLGGLQSGASVTLGVRLVPYAHRHFTSSVAARVSRRKYWGVDALVGYEYGRFVTYGFGRYWHMPEEDYYGLASLPLTPERTNYRHDQGLAGGLVGISLAPRTLAGIHASYMANWIGEGLDDDYPPVGAVFSPLTTPGLGESIHYAVWGAFFEYDSRDVPYARTFGRRFAPTQRRLNLISLVATRGIYLSAEHRRYVHLDGSQYGFNEFEIDTEQFLPIRHGYHVFAFREYLLWTYTEGGGDVPFYMMPALGGSRTLRGFAHNRFRDRSALFGTAEYRWRVWEALQLALFTDAGYVFDDFESLEWEDPEVGYGIGFRVLVGQHVPLRVDIARSAEDNFRLYLRLHSFF